MIRKTAHASVIVPEMLTQRTLNTSERAGGRVGEDPDSTSPTLSMVVWLDLSKFDLQPYAGKWYAVLDSYPAFEFTGTDIQANYTWKDGVFAIDNSERFLGVIPIHVKATSRWAELQSGCPTLLVKFPGNPVEGRYQVCAIDVAYTWVLVYSARPGQAEAWLMARDPHIWPPEVEVHFRDILREKDFTKQLRRIPRIWV